MTEQLNKSIGGGAMNDPTIYKTRSGMELINADEYFNLKYKYERLMGAVKLVFRDDRINISEIAVKALYVAIKWDER